MSSLNFQFQGVIYTVVQPPTSHYLQPNSLDTHTQPDTDNLGIILGGKPNKPMRCSAYLVGEGGSFWLNQVIEYVLMPVFLHNRTQIIQLERSDIFFHKKFLHVRLNFPLTPCRNFFCLKGSVNSKCRILGTHSFLNLSSMSVLKGLLCSIFTTAQEFPAKFKDT